MIPDIHVVFIHSSTEGLIITEMIAPLSIRQRLDVSLVTETFPPEINGVAMTLSRLVSGLDRRGHAVQVVRPRQPGDLGEGTAVSERVSEVLRPGFPIPRYPHLRMGLPSGGALKKLWMQRRPDIVHIATEGPLGRSALASARALGIPVSSSFHTNFHDYSKHYGMGFLHRPVLGYLRRFHNQTACTMVPSLDLIENLEQAGYRNLVQLGRGVDTSLFSPAHRSEELRASWGVSPGDLVIIHVGRVAREKDIPHAIAAFQEIRARQPGTRMVVVGDGPMRSDLAAAHPGVRFTGVLPVHEVARHYASGDLFLFPSTSETWGNVLLEAMASGLACVAYDYAAAHQHVRHGHNGLAVPVGDRQAFNAHALTAAGSLNFISELGRNARQTTLAISWDRVVDRFADLLGRVADDRF